MNKFRRLLPISAVLSLLPQPTPGMAQSFDCAKASGSVEWEICQNRSLADLDSSLAKEFDNVKTNSPDRKDDIVGEQRGWLSLRDEMCGKDRERGDPSIHECLKAAYENRHRLLESRTRGAREGPVNEQNELYNAIVGRSTDFLGIKKYLFELYRSSFSDCGQILSAEDLRDPTRLFYVSPVRLDVRGAYGYVSYPLNACFSAAANTDILVLLPTKKGYRVVAERTAQQVNVLSVVTNGFYDIDFQMHGGAYESTHFEYKYNGSRYIKIGCTDWRYPMSDLDSSKGILSKPEVTPCKKTPLHRKS